MNFTSTKPELSKRDVFLGKSAPVLVKKSKLSRSLCSFYFARSVSRCKMTFYRVVSAALVPICWVFLAVAEEEVVKTTRGTTATTRPAVSNSSRPNSTHSGGDGRGLFNGFNVTSSMIQRALYVLICITGIGVLYFLIRAVR